MADQKLSPLKKLALFGSIARAFIVWLVVALTLSNEPPMARFLVGAAAAGSVGVIVVVGSTVLGFAAAVRTIMKESKNSDHE